MLHDPVLKEEIIEHFQNGPRPQKKRYLDGTFGRGGHTQAVFESFSEIEVVAMDRDIQALEYAKEKFPTQIKAGKLQLVQGNFVDFNKDKFGLFDLMLLDLGVSSPQLDQAERGFSFYHDGPLDMRMDQSQELDAAQIINQESETRLIEIFKNYGEIYSPFRVVRAIVNDRKTTPYTTTRELASLIERVEGWRQKGHHPATRYFMALRLVVNEELKAVEVGLPKLMAGLNHGGRLAVLTFHSLEDRIVKNIFRNAGDLGRSVNKKVIQASDAEIERNPRSRSAKLRVFERSLG